MSTYDFDVAVLGSGSGGFAAARTTSAAGLNTVVIDGGKEISGLCILRGCMPTKALLYAAEVKHLASRAAIWGIEVSGVGYDFGRVMERKRAMVKEFSDCRMSQLSCGKFKLIREWGRFVDPHTLLLSDGSKLTAKNFVIGTGSVISKSPLPQLEEVGYITSDEALELKQLPKSIIVLGGGSIAVEFAQFFSRMDVKVTLIQRSEHLLKDFDPEAGDALARVFREEGMDVYTKTKLLNAGITGQNKWISFEHEGGIVRVEAEEIFYGLGRVPNTSGLGLELAGVELESGRIVCDSGMRTSVPHIFAAGDCTGPYEVVHLAVTQGEIAGHNIVRPQKEKRMDYRLMTHVVFTEPQVAMVGLNLKNASSRNIPHLSASYPFNDHGKSILMAVNQGYVSLMADPSSGEIIGGTCIGPMGGELIHEIITAMHKRMTVRELATMPHYHPTLMEIWTYPAEEIADKMDPAWREK